MTSLIEMLKVNLKQRAYSPKAQFKQLAIGTLLSTAAMTFLSLTNAFDKQWLFITLQLFILFAVTYAIPGYIGVWLWRMKNVFYGKDNQS